MWSIMKRRMNRSFRSRGGRVELKKEVMRDAFLCWWGFLSTSVQNCKKVFHSTCPFIRFKILSSLLETISDFFLTQDTNLEQLKRHHKSEAEAFVFASGAWLPKAKSPTFFSEIWCYFRIMAYIRLNKYTYKKCIFYKKNQDNPNKKLL